MENLDTKTLIGVIILLFSVIVYFTKRIFDNTESISKDVSEIKPKVDILWQDKLSSVHSPRQLNERGDELLAKSGIKEIEKSVEEVMRQLPIHCPDVIDKLKDGAFKTGSDLGSILFVGSIYLRNQIFPDLGFSLTDLDKEKIKS